MHRSRGALGFFLANTGNFRGGEQRASEISRRQGSEMQLDSLVRQESQRPSAQELRIVRVSE
jgi:hypothetical protein